MRTGHEGSHTARDPPPCSSAAGRAAVGESLRPGGQGSTRRGLAGNVTTHRPAHLCFAHFVKRKYWLPPPRSTPPLSPPGSRRHRGSAFNAAARGGPHGASGGGRFIHVGAGRAFRLSWPRVQIRVKIRRRPRAPRGSQGAFGLGLLCFMNTGSNCISGLAAVHLPEFSGTTPLPIHLLLLC